MPAAAGKTMTTVLWGAAAAVWFGMMTWLSHQPGPGTSRTSRELAEELHSLLPGIKTESSTGCCARQHTRCSLPGWRCWSVWRCNRQAAGRDCSGGHCAASLVLGR